MDQIEGASKRLDYSKNKSLNVKVYRSAYGASEYELPRTICPYFWKSVFAWLMLIPAFPGHLINIFSRDYEVKANWGIVHIPIVMICSLFYFSEKPSCTHSFLEHYGVGWLIGLCLAVCIAVFCAVVACIIYAKDWIVEKREKARYERYRAENELLDEMSFEEQEEYLRLKRLSEHKEPKQWMIVEWFKSFKEKHCKMINWID
jgi:hypothetical protein